MAKDINKKSFDEGTSIKLELFKLYLREWFPVFISRKVEKIEVFDFFAGSGTDANGNPGSPLIILDEISNQCEKLVQSNIRLKVLFNDLDGNKIDILSGNIGEHLKTCSSCSKYDFCTNPNFSCPFEIKLTKEDFKDLFERCYNYFYSTQGIPRLLIIDQYGIKHVSESIFKKLISLRHADFIFFISTSYLKRFKEQPEFLKYLSINEIEFDSSNPYSSHRAVFNYYKSLLAGKKYYLGQFSIRKNGNIYGVIFGSGHPLGLKKFLDVAWKLDVHTGETNFDIDNDSVRVGQYSFDFDNDGSANKVKKLVGYESELLKYLEDGRSNIEIYLFSIENGISIKKTNEILKRLEEQNMLTFGGEVRRRGAFYLDFEPDKKIIIKAL